MFKKIAAAIAFSPRMEAILFEARRLHELYDSELMLIHVGEKNEEKTMKLENALTKAQINSAKVNIFWETGDPAKVILQVCEEQQVALLLAGALRKENLFKYYTGSVARSILRKANCSVLVLIAPSSKPVFFNRIVIHAGDTDNSVHTIRAGCFIGQKEQSQQLHIVKEIKMYGFTMALAGEDPEHEYTETRRKIVQEKIKEVQDQMAHCPCEGLKVNIKIVSGRSGFELAKFSRTTEANLLIMQAPDRNLNILDRMFPHDLEYLLEDLPANLLLVQAN